MGRAETRAQLSPSKAHNSTDPSTSCGGLSCSLASGVHVSTSAPLVRRQMRYRDAKPAPMFIVSWQDAPGSSSLHESGKESKRKRAGEEGGATGRRAMQRRTTMSRWTGSHFQQLKLPF